MLAFRGLGFPLACRQETLLSTTARSGGCLEVVCSAQLIDVCHVHLAGHLQEDVSCS